MGELIDLSETIATCLPVDKNSLAIKQNKTEHVIVIIILLAQSMLVSGQRGLNFKFITGESIFKTVQN